MEAIRVRGLVCCDNQHARQIRRLSGAAIRKFPRPVPAANRHGGISIGVHTPFQSHSARQAAAPVEDSSKAGTSLVESVWRWWQSRAEGRAALIAVLATLLTQPVQPAMAETTVAGIAHEGSWFASYPEALLAGSVLIGVASFSSMVLARPVGEADETSLTNTEVPRTYDPVTLSDYWASRPVRVVSRAVTIIFEVAKFAARLQKDELLGVVSQKRAKRALQLRVLVEQLGPTYIKLAQAFSTRGDLLPPEYITEIEKLQESVKPFPCETAKLLIQEELGCESTAVFEHISESPIAAASIGQVYKAKLSPAYGGAEVAVKVQRPGILETVALDLYIIRTLAGVLKDARPAVTGSTDFVALIDDWGKRFFTEMKFQSEGLNSAQFRRQMMERDLLGVIAPRTYWEVSSDIVLVSEWIDGQKLSDSSRQDVRQLCTSLLNCYLVQLLDTGFMHADPHPGNLLVTYEGNLCILDWGLITEVNAETRVRLVEFLVHMQMEDWERVGIDLQELGFVSPEGGSPKEQGLIEPLGNILGQLTSNKAGVNIEKITRDLDDLSREYPYFRIPPYFALILRAFSVIEGIALAVDPGYTIIRECMPYLAQRVLADNTPRMQQLLRQLLYGDGTRLDIARLRRLSEGFAGYQTDSRITLSTVRNNGEKAAVSKSASADAGIASAAGADTPVPVIDGRVKEALRMVLRAGGSFSQEIVINELVNAVDALSREALLDLVDFLTLGFPSGSSRRTLRSGPLSPLRAILMPFLAGPLDLIRSPIRNGVELSEEDKDALATVKAIMELIADEASNTPSANATWARAMAQDPRMSLRNSVAAGQELASLAGDIAPGLANVVTTVAVRLLERILARLAEPLEVQQTAFKPSAWR